MPSHLKAAEATAHLDISLQVREVSVLQGQPQIPSLPMLGKPCSPDSWVIKPEISKAAVQQDLICRTWK